MTYPALFNAWSGVALNRRKFPIKRRRLNNVWQEKEEGKKTEEMKHYSNSTWPLEVDKV